MTRKLTTAFILTILLSSAAVAQQDSTVNAKLDSLLYYQNKILALQKQIYTEVVQYKEPLAGKKYGIEFNPAFLLMSLSQSYVILRSADLLFRFSSSNVATQVQESAYHHMERPDENILPEHHLSRHSSIRQFI